MDTGSLKDGVRRYWQERICGTRYGKTVGDDVNDLGPIALQRMAESRYQLEPYIPAFAGFGSAKGKTVLEIGVGGGVDFESWIRHGAHATGVDLTETGVALTKKRLRENGIAEDSYDLFVGDAENLPFEDNTFDIIYSWGVLHHTPNTVRAVGEVFRVLAKGGEFRGMVYHVPSVVGWMLWFRYCFLKGKVFRSPRRAIFDHLESPGTKAYTVDEMGRILEEAGFTDTQVYPKLGPGDLLQSTPSEKYQSFIYTMVWKLYPRSLIRFLGDRFGLNLHLVGRKV